MREEEPNWFSRWEDELPTPEELTPLSQTLITPDLALAFDISTPNSTSNSTHHTPPRSQSQSHSQQQQMEYDSSDLAGGGGGDDQARTLKRPRLVWTPQLHKRFVDAVAHLGIKNAVPKTIMQLMSVDGLTRENVASHLQKYRLYLKRMQGHSSGAPVSAADSAMEHLFASAPVPHHFLNRGAGEQFTPFVAPVAALQHHQMAAAAAAAHQQQQYFHQRHIGQLGSPPGSGFDLGFHPRQQQGMHRMVGSAGVRIPPPLLPPGSYADEMDGSAGGRDGGRRVLTLFPTNED